VRLGAGEARSNASHGCYSAPIADQFVRVTERRARGAQADANVGFRQDGPKLNLTFATTVSIVAAGGMRGRGSYGPGPAMAGGQ